MKKLGTDVDRDTRYHIWEDSNISIANITSNQQVTLTKDEASHLKELLNTIDFTLTPQPCKTK